jgi:hypothetical protein
VSALVPSVAAAEPHSWRCGNRLVGIGQTTVQVHWLCGDPAERSTETVYVTERVARDVAVTRAVAVEAWLYNRGPKQFLRLLTFHDGTLVTIDEGTYGY